MSPTYNFPDKKYVYEGYKPFAFLSHSHCDLHRVRYYIEGLHRAGFRIWFDTGIFTGASWPENRAFHIQECECFICFMSDDSINSFEMIDELRFAESFKKHILLVYLEECVLPPALEMKCSMLQSYHADKSKNDNDVLAALCSSAFLQACNKHVVPNTHMHSDTELMPPNIYSCIKHLEYLMNRNNHIDILLRTKPEKKKRELSARYHLYFSSSTLLDQDGQYSDMMDTQKLVFEEHE